MFTRIMAIFSISLVLIDITESAPALANVRRQILSEVPGYIPVYIRAGETPLEDINPDLAEAFKYYAQKHGRLTFGRSIEEESDNSDIKSGFSEKVKLSDIDRVSLDEELIPEDESDVAEQKKSTDSQYIQKISRS